MKRILLMVGMGSIFLAHAQAQVPTTRYSLLYGFQRPGSRNSANSKPGMVTIAWDDYREGDIVRGKFIEAAFIARPELAVFKPGATFEDSASFHFVYGKQRRDYTGHQYFGTAHGWGLCLLGFLPFPAYVSKTSIGYESGPVFTQFTGTLAIAGNISTSLSLGLGVRF